jgi:hypothetical protein
MLCHPAADGGILSGAGVALITITLAVILEVLPTSSVIVVFGRNVQAIHAFVEVVYAAVVFDVPSRGDDHVLRGSRSGGRSGRRLE